MGWAARYNRGSWGWLRSLSLYVRFRVACLLLVRRRFRGVRPLLVWAVTGCRLRLSR